eukprot:scaffold135138_cov53-Attheya_sp.AAC.1
MANAEMAIMAPPLGYIRYRSRSPTVPAGSLWGEMHIVRYVLRNDGRLDRSRSSFQQSNNWIESLSFSPHHLIPELYLALCYTMRAPAPLSLYGGNPWSRATVDFLGHSLLRML